MDSILESTKSYVGISPDEFSFDSDILMHINAIMYVLTDFGIGPSTPFIVEDASDEWSDLLGEDPIGGVREYVHMRVRMLFDPPTNPQIMDSLKNQIAEFEWRIVSEADRRAREVTSE